MNTLLSKKYIKFIVLFFGFIFWPFNATVGLTVIFLGLTWMAFSIAVKNKFLKIIKYVFIALLSLLTIFTPFVDTPDNTEKITVKDTKEDTKKPAIEKDKKEEKKKKEELKQNTKAKEEKKKLEQQEEQKLKTTNELVAKNKYLLDTKSKDDTSFEVVNNNKADFDYKNLKTETYQNYSDLDSLGRVGVANAILGKETIGTDQKGDMSEIHPTGWTEANYQNIETKDLYNHCYLISSHLSSGNSKPTNVMTATNQLKSLGMAQFEKKVLDYIKSTDNHVRYRVTPYFKDDELLARGVQMEAYSIEDNGEGINYNVYIYNTQKDIRINYANGESELIESQPKPSVAKTANTFTSSSTNVTTNDSTEDLQLKASVKQKKYHHPGCRNCKRIKDKNAIYFKTIEEAENAGYIPAKCCN